MKGTALSEKAYSIIKERLNSFEKGKHLSVRQIAKQLGMSYTPVREAFHRLEREGFLERVPNVGFFVARMDINDIIEIFQVRECLERFVLEKVFDIITDDEIRVLSDCVRQQEVFLGKGDIKQYMKMDERFHFVFFELYGNRHFIRLIKNVREQYLICSDRIAKAGSAEAIMEHKQIIEHIKNRDKEKALSLMVAHIENAKQRMKEGYIRLLDL